MPRKKQEINARALMWKDAEGNPAPIDTDAPPRGDFSEPENLVEMAKHAHAITEVDPEGKAVKTEPMTPEELRRTFAQLSPERAAALADMLQKSVQAAAEAAAEAAAKAAAEVIRTETKPAQVDTETPYLGPEFEPPKRHRSNYVVSTSILAKALPKIKNMQEMTLVNIPQEKVKVTLVDRNLPPGVTLSFEDCRILDALGMLWEEGWRDVTAQMVYNKMWANPPGHRVPPEEVDRINARIAHFSTTDFMLVAEEKYLDKRGATPELKARLRRKKNNLVLMQGGDQERNGQTVFVWHMYDCPPVYLYSRYLDREHGTIEVEAVLLHPQGRRSKQKLLTAYYLAIRADQVAKTSASGEGTILLETVYKEICGEEPQNTNYGRKKLRRFLLDCFTPVLEHFKQHGELVAYRAEVNLKGKPAIKITIPSEKIIYQAPNQITGEKGENE